MDQHGGCTAEEATRVEKWCTLALAKRTVQFVAVASFFSFFVSYFSSFSAYNLHFSTLIFSLFAHAIDRKYMFLICNAILAFLGKNLSFSSSSSAGFPKSAEDGVKQMPAISVEESPVEYDISPVAGNEETEQQEEGDEVIKVVEEEEDEDSSTVEQVNDADEVIKVVEEEEDEDEENSSTVEQVNDARVSTEELNQKFEEFIRKMKEEIRIEAQQQIITV